MTTQLKINMPDLYEHDYVLWLDKTLNVLKTKDIDNLDWEHLQQEIEALGNEQRHKVDSYLKQLLIHLLLYGYWLSKRDECAQGWEEEIDNFRDELEALLESKTLANYFRQRINIMYVKARRRVIKKTQLNPQIFPENCPFSIEQILDFDFLPA